MNHKNSLPTSLEAKQIAHQFSRAAWTYDSVSQLQQAMSDRLIAEIPAKQTGRLVDFGCGTGNSLATLARSRPGLALAGLDLAAGMIDAARKKLSVLKPENPIELAVADLVKSGLADQSIDIAFSNAAIQWAKLESALAEMHRVLRSGGTVLLSSFGPATLAEIRQAWLAIGDTKPRVHAFTSVDEIRAELWRAGFTRIEIETELLKVDYPDARALFWAIKHLGATNALSHRSGGLLGKSRFQQLCRWLDDHRNEGRITIQFEAIFMTAEKAP